MDATIDIKSLEEAVTVFYRSGAQQQSNAHDWLTKAQLSPQAWSFVWDLMQLGKVTQTQNPFGEIPFPVKFNQKISTVQKFNQNQFDLHFCACSHRKFSSLVQQHCIQNC